MMSYLKSAILFQETKKLNIHMVLLLLEEPSVIVK